MRFPFRINRSAFGAGSWTGPKGRTRELDIEVRITLCACRENLVVGLQNTLMGNFDQAVVFLGERNGLVEGKDLGWRGGGFLSHSGAAEAKKNITKNEGAKA